MSTTLEQPKTQSRKLAQTVAIVTGASSGIGAATAHELARHGASVVVAARRKDRLDELVRDLEAEMNGSAKALAIETDMTDAASIRRMIEHTSKTFGRIDILVNNAGVMLLGLIENADPSEWHRMLDLNVRALMEATHAALPALLAAAQTDPRRVADIVNISSVAGRVARMGSGAYNATKFAVNGFSESLRQEFAQKYVRVTVIEPGLVATELAGHNSGEVQAMMKQRFGDIEQLEAQDIAESIGFAVTRPRRACVNELLVRPTLQQE